MTQKWNLQDIRPVQTKKPRTEEAEMTISPSHRPIEMTRDVADEVMSIRIQDGNKKKNKSLFYAILIFVVIVGSGFVFSAFMNGAEITVYPRHREPNVNATFEAKKTPQNEEIAYEVMTLEATGERQVKATGEEEIVMQAVGTIFIYNEQQKESLRLVTNTRFQSPDGKIFKIKDSAVVPGYTTDQSGKKIPGVITAEVYADQVGEEYNLGPTKFTVPGFKDSPEYATIYGQSTEGFTGGYNGKRFKIDDAELQTAQQALRTELRDSLLERIDAEKPAGFILFKDSVTFTYESLPQVAYGDNLVTMKEKVLLRIPIFKDGDFANFIARQTVPAYDGNPVRIADYSVFTFKYTEATTSASDISNYTSISFNLAGRPQIIWKYDAEKLKADLLNAQKSALPAVLGAFPAIEKANAVIRPFWKTKFPTNIEKVKVTEIVNPV